MDKGCLEIKDLSFSYPSWSGFEAKEIFSGLTLEVSPGEIGVVFGRPESGKSTLALIIAALIPLHTGGEISGRVMLDDKNTLKTEPADFIENCGIVFQDPEKQTVTTECFTEAAFALESLGIKEQEIINRVESAFDKLGVRHLLNSPVAETSGGEKKKLALAGLISVKPDLWILDETIEELDNPSRIALLKLLRESGKTILIFSSKYFKAFSDADAFFLLKDGEISDRESYPFKQEFRKKLITEGVIPDFNDYKRDENTVHDSERGLLLKAENLRYSYEGGSFELSVDSFRLAEQETVSIVGRNGCGKSTLARMLCGLAEPRTGRIFAADGAAGISIDEPVDSVLLNSFCAYMFQNPDYQIFLPTVFDELSWGLKEAGYSSKVIKARVEAAIADFRLPNASTPPAMMSFSARKRLQAAVYYLLKRPVFILDEADTGLSFPDFIDLTVKLKQNCRGLIIITHNLELASVASDRVLGMSGGRLYEDILDYSPEKLNEWLTDSAERDEEGL
ncbi:MAG TPA: hypothetical protein DCO79_04045 [Spirochaeta sp.]|nr:hypothetical protein [Spirochaeta sp.]